MQSAYKQYTSIPPNRHLRPLGVAVAIALWLLLVMLHLIIQSDTFTFVEALADLIVILMGTTVFLTWATRRLQQRETQIQRHVEQLEALREAALALTAELDLDAVLQKVVDLSRSLVGARYGALSVLAEDGVHLEEFITSGLSPEQRAQIGTLPQGHGLLALPIREHRPVSIPDMTRDARAVGFPPHHPTMRSLLAVPIISKGKSIGSLFLADKLATNTWNKAESTCFALQDQEILVMFATQAAIAIENARLYRQIEQLAILQERERFSRNLHDGIIQSIYAIGLMLEDGQQRIETEPQIVHERIGRVIHDLNNVILDIRSYILDLSPQRFQDHDLRAGIEALVHDLRVDSFLDVGLEMAPIEPGTLSAGQTAEILHIAQEALANVQRHALATQVHVSLQCTGGQLLLTIEDNGTGFDPQSVTTTGGLHNMQERARVLNGQLQIDSAEGGSTCIRLTMPL
jgi:signal transduction histidine kinase